MRTISLYVCLSLLSLLLVFSTSVRGEGEVEESAVSLEQDFAMLEQQLDSEPSLIQLSSSADSDSSRRKNSGGGGVQRGGKERKTGLFLGKGTPDGSQLPPWDPFRMNIRHERRAKWKQARRQAKVDKETKLEYCRAARARRRRREARERRELERERRRLKAEKCRKARLAKLAKKNSDRDGAFETDLMEVESEINAATEVELELNNEVAADEMAVMEDEAQANADAAEAEQDSIEQEEDILAENNSELEDEFESSDELDAEAEAEDDMESELESEEEGENESEAEDSLLESDSTDSRRSRRGDDDELRPTSHVTYGLGELHEENDDSRAVFHRRAKIQEVVRFEKSLLSDGGVAVVKGVTKMPCGKDVTDKGLFAAEISTNLQNTVAAAQPKPAWIDDPLHAVQRLPVVPAIIRKGEVDEYGDPVQ